MYEVIGVARHQVTTLDVWNGRDGGFERVEEIFALAFEGDLDEHGHASANELSVDHGRVVVDHAVGFEATDSPMTCRR